MRISPAATTHRRSEPERRTPTQTPTHASSSARHSTAKPNPFGTLITSLPAAAPVVASPKGERPQSASRLQHRRSEARKPSHGLGQRTALKDAGSGVVSTPRAVGSEIAGQTGAHLLQPILPPSPSSKSDEGRRSSKPARDERKGTKSALEERKHSKMATSSVATPPSVMSGPIGKAVATSPTPTRATTPQGTAAPGGAGPPAEGATERARAKSPPHVAKAGGAAAAGNTATPVPGGDTSSSAPPPGEDLKDGSKVVMRKYVMFMSDEDVMGEGTSSICRKGKNLETGDMVAIKMYKKKKRKGHGRDVTDEVTMKKFQRQIAVLKELQKPLAQPQDGSLWHDQLASTKSTKLFMQLVDYSRDAGGEPGPDPDDSVMYVITEMAQYSLKDYIKHRRDQNKLLSKDAVRSLTRAIVLVTAGLHAKGLVHLDLKPENLMMFNGCLKLIDVDGCVKIGTTVLTSDSSLSFSPCYCAPEWANFLIQDVDEPKLMVSPALDAWSIGMTICELVTLDAALKHTYASFVRNGRSYREAGVHFMDWLSSLEQPPLPKQIEKFDKSLEAFLTQCLLVCDPVQRMSLAQSLTHPYITDPGAAAGKKKQDKQPTENRLAEVDAEGAPRHKRHRAEDHSDKYIHKGMLWKLNWDGNPEDPSHWLRRDMWVANNGSVCYFSLKEDKRLVLFDAHQVSRAAVTRFQGGARDPAFTFRTKENAQDHEGDAGTGVFACESESEYDAWMRAFEKSKNLILQTIQLGPNLVQDLRTFRLSVHNRRMAITGEKRHQDKFVAVFKARLWKLKANGNRMEDGDWFERSMWLSKNGSLVYWSAKEDKELVYFSSQDIESASVEVIPDEQSCRQWAFQVQLPPAKDMEFAPSSFAAESEEMRDRWIREFRYFERH